MCVCLCVRPDLADDETNRAIQGAIPDIVYDDPKDGKQRVVELKFHSQCKTRDPRGKPQGGARAFKNGSKRYTRVT